MMKKIAFLILLPILAVAAPEKTHFKGFVKIAEGHELFVDYQYAKPGQPTVVLLNGLTYSTKQWERFAQELVDQGVGVFRYDPMGMGETLLKYAPATSDFPIEEQAKDLHTLLAKFNLNKNLNLVGLSYGGGLSFLYATQHPEEISNLIAMAPYTEPLQALDQWIKSQIWYTHQTQPWNPATEDELYAFFYHQVVYSTYPTAEPIVLENPYKLEAVFHLGMGIRKFIANKIVSQLPKNSLHLLVAGNDQYIPRAILEQFWKDTPASVKASYIVVNNSEHKIPEAVPRFSAALVREILSKRAVFSQGQEMDADPLAGTLKYKGGRIDLPREY